MRAEAPVILTVVLLRLSVVDSDLERTSSNIHTISVNEHSRYPMSVYERDFSAASTPIKK